jgi:ribonuclease III
MNEPALAKLQERLGIVVADVGRLERALTHRSATIDHPLDSNERMEFLGDSIVGLIVCEALYERFPFYSEGELAKSKAYVVSETALAGAALTMGLEEFLLLSNSEAATGGRRRRSILADAFEALIAAIYLDCGISVARRVVLSALEEALLTAATEQHRRDYKSALQEVTQARNRRTPAYRILLETGQEHDKTFVAEAVLDGEPIGRGSGKSKKEAEQAAAYDALTKLPRDFAAAVPDNEPSPESRGPSGTWICKNGVQ